jgi:hypothetical protein
MKLNTDKPTVQLQFSHLMLTTKNSYQNYIFVNGLSKHNSRALQQMAVTLFLVSEVPFNSYVSTTDHTTREKDLKVG